MSYIVCHTRYGVVNIGFMHNLPLWKAVFGKMIEYREKDYKKIFFESGYIMENGV